MNSFLIIRKCNLFYNRKLLDPDSVFVLYVNMWPSPSDQEMQNAFLGGRSGGPHALLLYTGPVAFGAPATDRIDAPTSVALIRPIGAGNVAHLNLCIVCALKLVVSTSPLPPGRRGWGRWAAPAKTVSRVPFFPPHPHVAFVAFNSYKRPGRVDDTRIFG